MHFSNFSLVLLFYGARARASGSLEGAALGFLDNFPNVKEVLGPEISQWSTATAEASSFLCSVWEGKTPSPIAAVLTASPNSIFSSEWIALSTSVSSMSAKSEIPLVDDACSTLFATPTTAGALVTVWATVTVTEPPSPSGLLSSSEIPASPTAKSSLCAADKCCLYYQVAAGDSCFSIASSKGMPEADLEQWNPNMCGANLQIGAQLCISGPKTGAAPSYVSGISLGSSFAPSATSLPSSSSCAKYYKVAPGDSCSIISTSENISETNIEQWNPNMCGYNLQIGTMLCVSQPSNATLPIASGTSNNGSSPSASGSSTTCAPNTCCRYYKVVAGDSCEDIAASKGISVSSLEQWNPKKCGPDLPIGAELCVSGPLIGSAPPFGSNNSSTATTALPSSTSTGSMPSSTAPCAPNTCCHYYKVVAGDSCDSIATVAGILGSQIEQWNPGDCGPYLQINTYLCIDGPSKGAVPPKGSCPSDSCCHYQTIKSGDTCYNIATTVGIPESTLEAWNPGMCGPSLKVGSNICVEGPAAEVGFHAIPTSSTTGANTAGSSTSSSPAQESSSPGHRLSTLSVGGFFGLVLGTFLLL